MKKLFILLILAGIWALGFPQDKTLIDESFDTFKPTGWSTLDNQGGSGTTVNWAKSCYPMVMPDAQEQEEWLISPSISLNSLNTYQIKFDYYQHSTVASTTNLTLLVSYNNGVSWNTSTVNAAEVWNRNSDGTTSEDYWYTTVYFPVASPAVTAGAKFAFIYTSTAGDLMQAIDNVVLQEDPGGGMVDYRTYTFENGITAALWTKLANQAGTGSTHTWNDNFLTKVGEDATLLQEEWLLTPKIALSDAAYTDLVVSYTYYNLLNAGSQGVTLYVANQSDWTNFIPVDDYHWTNTGTRSFENRSFTLSSPTQYSPGDSLRFAFEFVTSAPGGVDFYLEHFTFETQFDETQVAADAEVDLVPLDTMIFPRPALYDASPTDLTGIAEGFWTVAPDGWTNTKVSKANWRRGGAVSGPVLSHDYSAFIDTIGANKATMNETLTTGVIPISYPSVGASYKLSFDWRTETNRNAGLNTDPILGTGVDYDYADIKMEIKINSGAWTKIWQEDDAALLDSTTVSLGNDYFYGWTDFQYYLDNPGKWYKAVLDLNKYITAATTSLQIRINYAGSGITGGYFNLDNLYVMQSKNPEFKLEAAEPFSVSSTFLSNYSSIPITQITNPYQLGAVITNNGVATFANNNLLAYVNEDGNGEETFGYKVLTPTVLPTKTTKYVTINVLQSAFTGGMRFQEGSSYDLRYEAADLNGNPTFDETVSFDVTSTEFKKYVSTPGLGVPVVAADDSSGGMGTLFEFKKADVIDDVSIYLGNVNNTSDFNMSIIKVASPTATTGTLVYTSPLVRMTYDDDFYTFTDDVSVAAGYYIFMFNQLDNYDLNIGYDDLTYTNGVIYRGSATKIYTTPGEVGELYMSINVKANVDPVISTTFVGDNRVLIAGKAVSLTFKATDENKDSLDWTYDASPSWLVNWIKFKDNGDGTTTLTGTPKAANLGTSEITVTVDDGRGGTDDYSFTFNVVSQVATFTPDYTEWFDGIDGTVPVNWAALYDQETGTNYHWNLYDDYMHMYGDNGNLQDEWVISPQIFLQNSSKSLDSTYRLEFDWSVYNFDYFCGGINGVLGSTDASGGSNYADVTLLVSTDNGLTWSVPIWKEDDPNLVAPVTEGIDGGEKWGYLSNHFYTSVIDLSAYSGKTVVFAFRYQSKYADYWNNSFSIDNFKVLRNKQVDISVISSADYQYLPERQVDQTNGVKFYAQIINQGIKVPDGATYTLKLPEVGFDTTVSITNAFFATGDTQVVEYTYHPQANINQWYYFTTTVIADGNATSGNTSHQVSTFIDPTQMERELDDNVEEMSFGYYDGLGVGYDLVNGDHLDYIYAYFGSGMSGGTPISVSIIKVNDFGDSSGELIATIDDDGGTPLTVSSGGHNFYPSDDQDINENLYLEPGKYVVMFNQLDKDYPLYIYKNNASYLPNNYIRGNFSNLYSDAYDQGNLYTYINFDSNDAPEFVDENNSTISTYSAEVLQGESGTFKIYASDGNEFDVLGFEQVTVPSFMAPSWLSFTSSADTAFMNIASGATAGTYPAQLMVGDGVDTTTLNITIKINGPQNMADQFTEPFDGWIENYPKVTTDDNTWMLKKGDNSKSTSYWYQYNSETRIDADYSNYQNEWLISPYVYFTAPSNDTTYWLKFNWYIEDVSLMIGGTQGVIGSGDNFNDYNYADLRVKVSSDGGNTWTLLWQEDDKDLVKAANSDMSYPYIDSYWNSMYSAKINVTSYAGQPLLFGFQYEGMQASAAGFDNIQVERVDPYVDLAITKYDVLPYRIPIIQAKNIDVKYSVVNKGTATSVAATISAQVTNDNGDLNPKYEETLQMAPLAGGETQEYSFPMAHATYGDDNLKYYFNFNVYQPYNVSASYTTKITDNVYSYDHGFDGDFTSESAGQGLGQVFQIYEQDVLTRVRLSSYEYNYLVVNIVQLDSADATSGTLIYTSSPQYKYYGEDAIDIEDVTLEPGYYAVFINDSDPNETFRMGYSNYSGDNPGTYIKGDASGFETVEENRFLFLRLMFDNSSPYFADAAGNWISLPDDVARVGMEYSKTIRAIDNDLGDIPQVIGVTLPSWLTITDDGNGFATLSGTPTAADLGDNLVVLRAIDGTTYDESGFTITVKENPAPRFITAPSLYAFVGKSYSYVAIASDMYGDTVTLTATIPSWLTKTGTGDTITLSGTPTASNVGEWVVKIVATDENDMTSQQIFTILVVANATPEFVSNPILTGDANIAYKYYVMATDDNMGDVVTITAPTIPAWLTLSATGNGRATLSGTPTAGGSFNVVLVATDGVGANSSQSFTIVVTMNVAPVFTSTAIIVATEDVKYVYSIIATDADGDYLYFVQDIMPNWLVMTVTGNGTAILQGIPTQKDVGANAVSIKVGDGTNTVTQSFTITVAEVNDPPIIVSPSVNDAKVGTVYQYTVEAFDEEGATLNYSASLPGWLSITNTFDGKAIISGTPSNDQVGDVEILVNVSDGYSETEQLYTLTVTGAVGIDDGNNSEVSIYPNPTNGKFNVANVQGATIYLYNTSGDLIKHIENTSVNESLDLTSYSAGNYVIRIVMQDQVITKSLNLIK